MRKPYEEPRVDVVSLGTNDMLLASDANLIPDDTSIDPTILF